jgi:hypothetical protein
MNVWSLYRSVATVARELARYDLDLVGVQEVRWEKWDTVRAGGYMFSMEKETKIMIGHFNTKLGREDIFKPTI